jgi:hypothetical protein
VGDKQEDGGKEPKEPLTEREWEALQELARDIVKEPGLAQDPEKKAKEQRRRDFIEGGREHWKAQVDFFKHMTTVSGASITVVIGISPSLLKRAGVLNTVFLFVALASLFVASLVSVGYLLQASSNLRRFSWGDVPEDLEPVW